MRWKEKERKVWEEISISVTLLNFRIFYQADWPYVESGYMCLTRKIDESFERGQTVMV